jgi:hypothetical protein
MYSPRKQQRQCSNSTQNLGDRDWSGREEQGPGKGAGIRLADGQKTILPVE